MVNFIDKIKAKKRIPQEVYSLIDSINKRYSEITLGNGNEEETLSHLISIINNDLEIERLNSLSCIGAIDGGIKKSDRFFLSSGCFGQTLCIGENGLHIHYWDDIHTGKVGEGVKKIISEDMPATPETIKKYNEQFNAENLKEAIINYTNKKNYIERVAVFDEHFKN